VSDLSNEYVIGDHNVDDFIGKLNASGQIRGLVPRDYSEHPQGCYASAPIWDISKMPLIPWEEVPERIKEMERTKSRISDIYETGDNGKSIPSLDQNGQGFCWFYSGTACVQAARAIAGMPYVPLSAHSGACKIFNFQDRGAWSCLGLDFIRDNGIVPQSLWPAKSMSRQYDTAENWAAAARFKMTEGWTDLAPRAYDRDISAQQIVTALLSRLPCAVDYNHMGHAMMVTDVVDAFPNRRFNDPMRYGVRHKNSWTDRYGIRGWGVFTGSKAFPDGGACVRVVVGS
jgi:hypothetical protein